MEERLASTDAEDSREQGEVERDRLGLVEECRSSFKKFDLETLTVEGGG